jgi:drug/metabolite transporter (DMT)-like permease
VLAVVLALTAAIGYGGSDFAAGLASRSAPVIQITLLASVIGFSVLAGLLYGERPTALALTGIVLALPAIVAVSASAGGAGGADGEAGPPAGRQAAGVVYGLVAGAFFALLFIGLDRAGSGSGMWPVAAAAAGELVAALVAAVAVHSFVLCGGRARLLAVIAGVAGAAGTILFFFASHRGFLAVTAVLTSLYPAVTIVLARTVLGERLTALRLGGLGLAGVCVSLIAVGGAG